LDIEEEASLLEVEASAWSELERGALSPESGFRQVSLCSVDASLRPQARMVVLRKANRRGRLLEFHSEIAASSKGDGDASWTSQ
jgi:pyridoxine/pyridoxamine 5'-phosphate oxidase